MKIFTKRFTKDLFLLALFGVLFYFLTHNSIAYPTPTTHVGVWSIEKLQKPLVFRIAGHNFFALRNAEGKIVSELHGLATDEKTNTWTYVGTGMGELLKVWEFDTSIFGTTHTMLPGIVIQEGDEESIRALWNKAKLCGEKINKKNIVYPPLGMSMYETKNSNAVAYTLSTCMGIQSKRIGIIVPGEQTNLLAP